MLYLLIAKQGTCIFVWFLHYSPVFLNPPGRTLPFQHVPRISLVQTIACTLRHGLTRLSKIVFHIFVHAGPKRLQPLYLMVKVLYYLSSKLVSEPTYLRRTSKMIQDNAIEYWDSTLFCIFISNMNSLKPFGHVSTIFC